MGRRKSGRPVGVPHRARPSHDKEQPILVVWKLVADLPPLDQPPQAAVVEAAVRALARSNSRRRTPFRVTYFSIRSGQLQLVVLAGSKRSLMAGLRGVGVWLARRINQHLQRQGQVLADRYDASPLLSARALAGFKML